jgi:hypothetical protein
MGIIRKIVGPKSKYDRSLPYTYMARIPAFDGDSEFYAHYFADTICGLIEYLEESGINSSDAELFGIYLKEEILLDKKYCTSENGKWLHRPEICKSLEKHYKNTLERQYKGHIEKSDCSYDDRNRTGSGPH